MLVARAHGAFNVGFGLWPLLHRRSFEALFGPKGDWWLVQTVAGLMVANGVALASTPARSGAVEVARRAGLGTAGVLGLIDVVHASRGRISRMYLLDAVSEAGWIAAWLLSARVRPGAGPRVPAAGR